MPETNFADYNGLGIFESMLEVPMKGAPNVVLLAIALFASSIARARPPHAAIEVRTGEATFARLYEVRVLAVADPHIATAESLPAGELLITGKSPGRTEAVALAGGKIAGIRIEVRDPGKPPPTRDGTSELAAARKSCPDLKLTGEGTGASLEVAPRSPGCRRALQALFDTGAFALGQVNVDFDADSLRAQLTEMEAALTAAGVKGVALAYQGATLVVAGHLSTPDAEKLLLALYRTAVGGLPVDASGLTVDAPAPAKAVR